MKNLSRTLLMFSTIALFWSCASSKKATTEGVTQIPSSQLASTVVDYSVAQGNLAQGVQAKSTLTLSMGSSEFAVGGNLKMIRDEIIQLSMTMMGLMEVARIELTPDYVLIQDRYNKRYIKAGWNEICLDSLGISFQTFQSLFWEQLFLIGNKKQPETKDFVLSSPGSNTLVPAEKSPCASSVQFVVDNNTGRLRETQLSLRGPHNLDLAWKYVGHTPLGNGSFPNSMQLSSLKNAQQLTVTLDLTRVEVNNNLHDIATDVNDGKYKPITMDDILNQYLKISR